MKPSIQLCASVCTETGHCSLTPTCKGWGCRFLGTPIEQLPITDREKAKLFSKVYQEAKSKGVLECPHYRSLFIDEVLENINKSNVTLQNMN
jgi:hypothetical protein